jgi:hypothetical protein
LRAKLQNGLDEIAFRAVDPNPDHRYQNCLQLGAAIRASTYR